MSYAAEIVVRKSKRNGKHYAGFASKYSIHNYDHVESFGRWFGCQMQYKPFNRAWQQACDTAANLNK